MHSLLRSLPLVLALLAACIDKDVAQKAIAAIQSEGRPDRMPVMLNARSPFRYPPPLYSSKVQGNVLLRIHIDSTGTVLAESTRVLESSGYSAFDSAAVKGSQELRYAPASLRGKPMAVSIQLPVFFRHPDAQPLPGDTVLHQRRPATRPPTAAPTQKP